jgi:hypothetical protein
MNRQQPPLPRHAVLLLGCGPATAFAAAVADDGDVVTSHPDGAVLTWTHEGEDLVLAGQIDAPAIVGGEAVTEILTPAPGLPHRRWPAARRAAVGPAAYRDRLVATIAALHDEAQPSGWPTYERIVVVGHGVAAVAGHDAVRALQRDGWDRRGLVTDLVTTGSPIAWLGVGDGPGCVPPDLASTRWTNVWFGHDRVAGPIAGASGMVDDVHLGTDRARALLGAAVPASRYWARRGDLDGDAHRERGRDRGTAGAALATAVLRQMLRPPPTLLLSSPRPMAPAQRDAVVEALGVAARYPTARGAIRVAVRLVEPAEGDQVVATRLLGAGRTIPVPADIALRGVRQALGPGATATVVVSRPGPST